MAYQDTDLGKARFAHTVAESRVARAEKELEKALEVETNAWLRLAALLDADTSS